MSERDDAFQVARDAELDGRWELAMEVRASVFESALAIDDLGLGNVPWDRYSWHGEFVSLDGAATGDFTRDDIDALLAYGTSGDEWDGETAGIVRLKDGRFVSWESSYGPTGDGFSEDAYGGDTDIWFATTAGTALEKISECGREILRWG